MNYVFANSLHSFPLKRKLFQTVFCRQPLIRVNEKKTDLSVHNMKMYSAFSILQTLKTEKKRKSIFPRSLPLKIFCKEVKNVFMLFPWHWRSKEFFFLTFRMTMFEHLDHSFFLYFKLFCEFESFQQILSCFLLLFQKPNQKDKQKK